jgi:two-component system, OmpR family, response regulator
VRLLVVEDDAKLAAAVARGLRAEGHAVDVAADGESGLLDAMVVDYDAIVLDLMLPRRDGLDVCRELRVRGCRSPVLLLTARGGVEDRIAGLDAGVDDYLPKPFHFGELLARVRALLRRGPVERPPRVVVGDLEVDPTTRRVARAGRPVELTAREFAVLEYLVAHAGEVVTRTQLLEHVWDANHIGSTNVVDQYIGALRRKLEQPLGRPLIHTLRGTGYRLEPTA